MSVIDPLEELEERMEAVGADEPLTVYIYQTHPIASRASVNPLEPRRDLDLLPQLVAHLKAEGASSGVFELKLRGPKKKHYGSATVPLTLPGESEANPERSEISAPDGQTTPAPVQTTPRARKTFEEQVLELVQAANLRRVQRLLEDVDDEAEDGEDGEEEETEEEEDRKENPAPVGFFAQVLGAVGVERAAAALEHGVGSLFETAREIGSSVVEQNKAKTRLFNRQTSAVSGTPGTGGPTVRLVTPQPAPAADHDKTAAK